MRDMQKDEIAGFKARLEKEKAVLERELGELGTKSESGDWVPKKPEDEAFGADRNDNADIIEGMQENNASLNELEGRLNLVIAALARIEAGTYGTCEACNEPIEPERLNANPAATTCMQHMNPKP
jgi:RNA polymerase-binding transcription factor DksA